jgi:hypothetical protein
MRTSAHGPNRNGAWESHRFDEGRLIHDPWPQANPSPSPDRQEKIRAGCRADRDHHTGLPRGVMRLAVEKALPGQVFLGPSVPHVHWVHDPHFAFLAQ